MKRRMPYGLANFEELATGPYYYIDKTQYIEKLEQVKYPVFLRPRRFGKSLLTEMLHWYYDIKAKDRFDAIFGNLYIGKNPTGNQNKYFVLILNFSGMDTFIEDDQQLLKEKFDKHIITQLQGFLMFYSELLFGAYDYHNDFFDKYKNDASAGLNYILQLLSSKQEKLYLCIDEYDSLTNALAIRYRYSTPDDNVYLNILQKGGFFRTFFETIKIHTKTTIDQVYITGILPITIADMNGGFNIATWITFDVEFTNMLGITSDEFNNLIEEVYSDYEITLDKQEVKTVIKKYYNGYRFLTGEKEVYNPMMTLYFLNHVIRNNQYPPELIDRNLMINYNQIAFLFGQNVEEAARVITEITDKKEYPFYSTLNVSFDMSDFKEGKYIPEGLYYSGILTHGEYPEALIIPNLITYEFALQYFEKLNNYERNNYNTGQWFGKFMVHGDVEALIDGFFRETIQAFPGDFFANVNESFYHGLFFHLLFNNTQRNTYEVLPEFNLTNGQVDIMFRTYPGAHVRRHFKILIELKRVAKHATDTELQQKFEEGVAQMKNYLIGEYADWQGIVVCFRGNLDYKMLVL